MVKDPNKLILVNANIGGLAAVPASECSFNATDGTILHERSGRKSMIVNLPNSET